MLRIALQQQSARVAGPGGSVLMRKWLGLKVGLLLLLFR